MEATVFLIDVAKIGECRCAYYCIVGYVACSFIVMIHMEWPYAHIIYQCMLLVDIRLFSSWMLCYSHAKWIVVIPLLLWVLNSLDKDFVHNPDFFLAAILISYRFDEFDSLLEQYRYNLVGRSLPLKTNCEGLCRKETLCQVQNIISTDYLKCVGRQ